MVNESSVFEPLKFYYMSKRHTALGQLFKKNNCSRRSRFLPLRVDPILKGLHCPGPGCSKLKMSLVNVSLKFQMLISQIHHYFLLKICEKLLQCKTFSHFFNKKFSVFGYKVIKHIRS